MPKPPPSPPHSDLDGVNRDEVRNDEAAVAAGQSPADLARAAEEDAARPEHAPDQPNPDDRTG